MSSQDSADAAATIAAYSSLTINNDCFLAGAVFVIYEYIITFDQEVKLFWKPKLNGAAVLFFLNRYFILLYCIYSWVVSIPMTMSDKSCTMVLEAGFGVRAFAYFVWAAFSGSRAFALSRSWVLGILVFLLSTVTIGINLSDFDFHFYGVNFPIWGCEGGITTSNPTILKTFTIVSRTCLIAADVLLICITWFALFKRGALNRGVDKYSFVVILLRDGTVYFIVLLLLNSLHLALTLLSYDSAFEETSNVTTFTEPITAVLVSRFLFHLQYANRKVVDGNCTSSETDAAASTGTLIFDRFVNSMGTSMDLGIGVVNDELNDEGDTGDTLNSETIIQAAERTTSDQNESEKVVIQPMASGSAV